METTVKGLTKLLSNLKDELQDKPVYIKDKEGNLVPFDVKFILKDPMNVWDKSKDNVESIILE